MSWDQDTVTIYRGLPDGGVAQTAQYPVGANPIAIVAGDLNGDGAIDLVSVNAHSSDLTLLFGNGRGAFPASATIRLPSQDQNNRPSGVHLADFNLDGHPDIVVVSQGTPSVRILYGNGAGFFFSTAALPSPANARAVAAGDFTGDGFPDIAVAQKNAVVTVYAGTAAGTFLRAQSFRVRPNPTGMAAADFNQDGILDLAITYANVSAAEIVRATQPGVFSVPGAAVGADDGEPDGTPGSLGAVVNHFGPAAAIVDRNAAGLVYLDRATRALHRVRMTDGTLTIAPLGIVSGSRTRCSSPT